MTVPYVILRSVSFYVILRSATTKNLGDPSLTLRMTVPYVILRSNGDEESNY